MKHKEKAIISAFFWLTGSVISSTAAQAAVPVIDLNQDNSGTYSTSPATPNDSGVSTYPADITPSGPISSDQSSTISDQPSKENLPLEVRVRLLEQQIANLTQMNLPAKMDDLQQQIQQLSGQLEVAQHTIETLTEQQRTFYQDLDERITKLSGGAASSVPGISTATAPSSAATTEKSDETSTTTATNNNSLAKKIAQAEASVTQNTPAAAKTETTITTAANNDEEKAYQAAFKLYANKNNAAATPLFEKFLKTYPKSGYVPNVHYWLSTIYDSTGQKELALQELKTLITQYPKNEKVPYALLKIAEIHNDQGLSTQAQQEWQKIIDLYPGSTPANLAKISLQQLDTSAPATTPMTSAPQ